LKKYISETNYDEEILEKDISSYLFTLKEAIKIGEDVPEQKLLPSHYVNAMRELYNYERRYSVVVNLADRVLINEACLDRKIIKEIRYWLCLSLARLRDRRVLEEVQKIDGADHDFLLGFYYRIVGRYDEAIERFNKVLERVPTFHRAKRELVQVYLNTEQYLDALDLARESYHADKNNLYYLQSYFRCLIKIDPEKYKNDLHDLLEALEKSNHEKAKEMYMSAKTQYIAVVENNFLKALNCANDTISAFQTNIYPYLNKLDIILRFENYEKLKEAINEIETNFEKDRDYIFNRLQYLASKTLLLAKEGNYEQAEILLEREIKPNFPEKTYLQLKNDIKRV
jgi:tetratricopeptide (TPR) repeat protein